jgi:hypothetical protein
MYPAYRLRKFKEAITSLCRLAVVVLVLFRVAPAQLSAPQIGDQESGSQVLKFIESGKLLSNMKWTITRTTLNAKPVIRKELIGEWFKDRTEPITWKEESVFEIADNTIRTLSWHKQSSGGEKETFQLDYSWDALTLLLHHFDALTGKKRNKTISLERNVVPGDALELMLRGLPYDRGPGYKHTIKVVLSDGSFIAVSITLVAEETVDTPLGRILCYKLEFKPTGLLGVVAPRMNYWVTKRAPHIMLKYEGRDNGLLEARTIRTLVDYKPLEWLKP